MRNEWLRIIGQFLWSLFVVPLPHAQKCVDEFIQHTHCTCTEAWKKDWKATIVDCRRFVIIISIVLMTMTMTMDWVLTIKRARDGTVDAYRTDKVLHNYICSVHLDYALCHIVVQGHDTTIECVYRIYCVPFSISTMYVSHAYVGKNKYPQYD